MWIIKYRLPFGLVTRVLNFRNKAKAEDWLDNAENLGYTIVDVDFI